MLLCENKPKINTYSVKKGTSHDKLWGKASFDHQT